MVFRIKGRKGGLFAGFIFGLIFSFGSIALLVWNEGRTVKRHRDLQLGAEIVISVLSDTVDPANDGKLVHMIGETAVLEPLYDSEFGVEAEAIKLIRKAEMYQWVESSKTDDDGHKQYNYDKRWESRVIDSTNFHRGGHDNPSTMTYRSETLVADPVHCAAFAVPDFLVEMIDTEHPVPRPDLAEASEAVRNVAKLTEDHVYFGRDPGSPEVGDVRVHFKVVLPGTTSIVAQQSSDSFVSFQADHGTVDLLFEGSASAEEMFAQAEAKNTMIAWAIRGGGFVVMGIGIAMLFSPLVMLTRWIPILGGLVGRGTTLIAFLLAGVVSSITVAVAWMAYRPLVGGAVLAITAVCAFFLVRALRKPNPPTPNLPANLPSTPAPTGGPPPPLPKP